MKKINNTPDEKSEIVFDPTSLKVHYKIGGETVKKNVEIPKTAEESIDEVAKGLSKGDIPTPQNKSGYGGYAGKTKESEGMRDSIEPVEVSGFSHFEQRASADSKAFKELVDSVEGMDFDPLGNEEEGLDKKASLEKKSGLTVGKGYSEEEIGREGFLLDFDPETGPIAYGRGENSERYMLRRTAEDEYLIVDKIAKKLSIDQRLQGVIEKFASAEKGNLYPGWSKDAEVVSTVAKLISMSTGLKEETLFNFISKGYKPSGEGI